MLKNLIALLHMSDKEFGVEFIHEKAFRDLGSGAVYVPLLLVCY